MKPFEKVEKSLQPKERILAVAVFDKPIFNVFVGPILILFLDILCICLYKGGLYVEFQKTSPDTGMVLFSIIILVLVNVMYFMVSFITLISGGLRRGRYLVVTNQRIMGLTNSLKKHNFHCEIDKVQSVEKSGNKISIVGNSLTYKFKYVKNGDLIKNAIKHEINRIAEEKEKKEKQMQAALMAAAMRGNYIPPQ